MSRKIYKGGGGIQVPMIPKKKIIGILLACAMLGVVIPALSGNSGAQSAIPQLNAVYKGWNGYDGNGVVYMAQQQNVFLDNLSSMYSSVSPESCQYGENSNQVVSSSMQTILSPTNPSKAFNTLTSSYQNYFLDSSSLHLECPIIGIHLNIVNIGSDRYLYCRDPADYKLVSNMRDYVTTSGLSSNVSYLSSSYESHFNNGVNLSNNANCISPDTQAASQVAYYGLSLVPVIGQIYSTGELASELAKDFGPAQHASQQCTISTSGTIYQNLQIINGTINGNVGQNNYVSVTQAYIQIPLVSYASSSNAFITFGAKSLITTGGGQCCKIGASSSQTIYLKPAVSICGYVYNDGNQYQNQNVCLIQTYNGVSTGFQLKTNNSGIWHFFAQPGATYKLAGGSNPSWGYSCCNIPSGDTSVANSGNSVMIPNGGSHFNLNEVNLQGTVYANGNPVQSAGVEVLINSTSQSTSTNSNGQFNMLVPFNSWVNVSISAGSYSYTVQSADVGSGTSFTMTFSYNTSSSSGGGGGGGGGGCVLYGTNITLANGLTTQVQNLYKGEKILSYNTHTHKLFKDKVKQIIITRNVTSVIKIDNFISLSGPNVQPVYVKTIHGRNEWIFLGQITKGMSLYNPQNNTWVKVTNITIVIGHFTVYEVVGSKEFWAQGHRRSDYIANGILVDRKLY